MMKEAIALVNGLFCGYTQNIVQNEPNDFVYSGYPIRILKINRYVTSYIQLVKFAQQNSILIRIRTDAVFTVSNNQKATVENKLKEFQNSLKAIDDMRTTVFIDGDNDVRLNLDVMYNPREEINNFIGVKLGVLGFTLLELYNLLSYNQLIDKTNSIKL